MAPEDRPIARTLGRLRHAKCTFGGTMGEQHDPRDERCAAFYRHAMRLMNEAGVPFLVGGAFAFQRYGGIARDTKDFDVFVRPSDAERAMAALAAAGYRTEMLAPHWLAKAFDGELLVDVIFSSGNGVATVDDDWFAHAVDGEVLGVPAKLVPPEEMIWQKAYIMERERFDGADVNHVIRLQHDHLDWDHLLERFGDHWRVLLAHLVLFGFAYPTERDKVPARIVRALVRKLNGELSASDDGDAVNQGTLLSRTQYQVDLRQWGYKDARMLPPAELTEEDLEPWDEAGARETGGKAP